MGYRCNKFCYHKIISLPVRISTYWKNNCKWRSWSKEVNSYFINITLNNNNITLDVVVTECEELSSNKDIGMLIGMDIITTGDFSITNYNEHTTMSFRTPSIQTIDFVRGMKGE